MRLLLRADTHRRVAGGLEVAASPDTPRREAWQWQVRVLDDRSGAAADSSTVPDAERITITLPRTGGPAVLEVASDPDVVAASAEVMTPRDPVELHRELREVLVLIVAKGCAEVEGRHRLGELDALVLEGDDPFSVPLRQLGQDPSSVAVVRIRSARDRAIGWVP